VYFDLNSEQMHAERIQLDFGTIETETNCGCESWTSVQMLNRNCSASMIAEQVNPKN
jgi:hypothetical protein